MMTTKKFKRAKILSLLILSRSSLVIKKKFHWQSSNVFFCHKEKDHSQCNCNSEFRKFELLNIMVKNCCTNGYAEKLSDYYAPIWYSCRYEEKHSHRVSVSGTKAERSSTIMAQEAIPKHAPGASKLRSLRWKRPSEG